MLVLLQITENCNLNCTYCFQGKKAKRSLTKEKGKEIIEFIMANCLELNEIAGEEKKLRLIFYGGEPLVEFDLLKNLFEFANYQAELLEIDIKYSLITNAYAITPEQLNFFERYKEYFSIKVSLDGNQPTQDAHRISLAGEGSFEQVYKNAKALNNIFHDVQIAMVVTPDQAANLYENVVFLMAEGFSKIEYEIDVFNSTWDLDTFNLLEEQVYLLKDFYLKYLQKDSDFVLVNFDNWVKSLIIGSESDSLCGAGKKSFFVNLDGEIYTCPLGNKVNECYFGDTRSGFNTNTDVINNLNFDLFSDECKECPYRCRCFLTCIAGNVRLTGKVYDISPLQCVRNKLNIEIGTELGNQLYKTMPELFQQRFLSKAAQFEAMQKRR